MAGYNRGIVATRKLNEKNKANLGRGGDTKIRKVDGKDSHVNALEAYLIDVNGKAGEEYAKRVGAGTVNPLTGMPEYHKPSMMVSGGKAVYSTAHLDITHSHPQTVFRGTEYSSDHDWSEAGQTYTLEQETAWAEQNKESWEKPPTYEELSSDDPADIAKQLTEFDPNLGAEDVKYFQDIFTDVPFGFLGEEQDLTTRGLKSAYGATMGALGSQQAALGRTTGRGFREAGKGRDIAVSRSGLATSGTITQGYETQKKDLFQDYTAGMGDIKRERGTALETLTLGKEGAGLDFRTAEYAEQQRQLDEYWDMIGLRQAAG